MDENTQEIVDALGQLGNVVVDTSSGAILADILAELKDIHGVLIDIEAK